MLFLMCSQFILVINALDSVTDGWQMVISCPPIKVCQDTSLTIGGLTGCSGFHSICSIKLLIGIIVVSEELGVLSLAYLDVH